MDRQSTFQVNKVNTPNVLCGACTFANASNPLRTNISTVNEAIGIRSLDWGGDSNLRLDLTESDPYSDDIDWTVRIVPRSITHEEYTPPPQETSHISSYIPPITLKSLPNVQSRRVVHDEYCTAKDFQSLREDYFQLRLNYESLTDGLRDRGVIGK